MAISDDDITSEPTSTGGVADFRANLCGRDGGTDGSADSGEGVADGGTNQGRS